MQAQPVATCACKHTRDYVSMRMLQLTIEFTDAGIFVDMQESARSGMTNSLVGKCKYAHFFEVSLVANLLLLGSLASVRKDIVL